MSKSSAVAHPNIALAKYWGKRDERLILPANSSFSVTLDGLEVKATVEFQAKLDRDQVRINGEDAKGRERERVVQLLDLVRETARLSQRARVETFSSAPKAAGLASSAAAFAALAKAASSAAGLDLGSRALSILARRGSGSAARSIEGGFVVWHRGERADGEDSFAEQLFPASHWLELRLVVALLSSAPKETSSREGMKRTVETSPYFESWARSAEADLAPMVRAVEKKDLAALVERAESNALLMHASAMGAVPAVIYFASGTLAVYRTVVGLREKGIPAGFTLDAGPNPVVLCEQASLAAVQQALSALPDVKQIVVTAPGPGARTVSEHLF